MTLKLNPEILRCAYAYLAETEPFSKWNLPDSEDVTFVVSRDRATFGWHEARRGKHKIAISSFNVGHTASLMSTMSHEMIHVHQSKSRLQLTHGKAFEQFSSQVSKVHGFDPKAF